MSLNVTEMFYSLQGEGARAGSANVFVRLQGCKTKDACYAFGVRCDTEFESGREMDIEEIASFVNDTGASNIIWTGGEPAQQLTEEIVGWFTKEHYFQAIETSGLFTVPNGLDYISLSPKVAEHVVKKNFTKVDELRYVRHSGQSIPQPSVEADHYFISPHCNGAEMDMDNLAHCIDLVKQYPKWRLSVQQHKLWKVL